MECLEYHQIAQKLIISFRMTFILMIVLQEKSQYKELSKEQIIDPVLNRGSCSLKGVSFLKQP